MCHRPKSRETAENHDIRDIGSKCYRQVRGKLFRAEQAVAELQDQGVNGINIYGSMVQGANPNHRGLILIVVISLSKEPDGRRPWLPLIAACALSAALPRGSVNPCLR